MTTQMLKKPNKSKSFDKQSEFNKQFVDSQLLSSRGYSFDKKEIRKKQVDLMKEYNEIKKTIQ